MLGARGRRLCLCDWMAEGRVEKTLRMIGRHAPEFHGPEEEDESVLDLAVRQLDGYFAGKLREFDLPLLLLGSDFRMRVWKALAEVPYGCTQTYGRLARNLGRPSAVRAVGGAVGANPLSIFIPCHRIVGAGGSPGGYAGGLEAKRLLLALERDAGILKCDNVSDTFGEF